MEYVLDEYAGEGEFYTFDGFGRLVKITRGPDVTTYTYNGDGQRVSRTHSGETRYYVWDGDQIILEKWPAAAIRYIRGVQLEYRYISAGSNNERQYYHYNARGDVITVIVGASTTAGFQGRTRFTYYYDAFGNFVNAVSPTDHNPFRYCAEFFDNESGLIYLRNRYYDPEIGRFISEDPIQSGLNWYVYCSQNPIRYVDPYGLRTSSSEPEGYPGGYEAYLLLTYQTMYANNWVFTLNTQNGATVFSLPGKSNVTGREVDIIKWLLDQLVPDWTGKVYYTDKLIIMNEVIWGNSNDRTIGPRTFLALVNLAGYSSALGTITPVYYSTMSVGLSDLNRIRNNSDYIIYPLLIVATTPGAAEELKAMEKRYNDQIMGMAMASGGLKFDIKQVSQVAKALGMNEVTRRAFGRYIESQKGGIPNNVNSSWKELMRIGKEFLGR